MTETTTRYPATLFVDYETSTVKVGVPGLLTEHRRDHGLVRAALREALEVVRAEHPEAKRLALTLQLGRGTEIREEVTRG